MGNAIDADATATGPRCYVECRLSNGVRPGEYGYRFFEGEDRLRVGVAPHAACLDASGMPFAPGEVLDSESTPGLVAGTLLGRDTGLDVVAVVDGLRLRQVLNNLLGNALKFAAGGAVELAVSARPGADGLAVSAEVRDTGPGIAPDMLERVFEPFAQTELGRAMGGGSKVASGSAGGGGGDGGSSSGGTPAPSGGSSASAGLPTITMSDALNPSYRQRPSGLWTV